MRIRGRRSTLAVSMVMAACWSSPATPGSRPPQELAATPGNLTSPQEIAALRHHAQEGRASYRKQRKTLRREATRPWRWGDVAGEFVTTEQKGEKACHPARDPRRVDFLKEGAPDVYAKAIAYYFEDEPPLELAVEARKRVLDLVDTRGFRGLRGFDWSGANQCILELAISIPVWIETALLLEATPVWTELDRESFTRWLVEEVYPKVAWASRVRRNNWGAAGSLAASLIARYVRDQSIELVEIEPQARRLSPEAAWKQHDAQQLQRIRTAWKGDSECRSFGIQVHGGIPDELRRGVGGCAARSILAAEDSSRNYQAMHVELLVYHAEALRRAGDDTLFGAQTTEGRPAILQAILFVIDNPSPGGRSWPWGTRSGTLAVAFHAYGDPRLAAAAERAPSFRGGRTLPYARLTALASGSAGRGSAALDDTAEGADR